MREHEEWQRKLKAWRRGFNWLNVILLLIAISPVLFWAAFAYRIATSSNSLDPEGGESGLKLYVDSGTGCHYVGSLLSITPRMGPGEKQVGCFAELDPDLKLETETP